ncbi:MAG: YHS domain-containing protein [Chloroflexi bacterium]|nr:YHS domain-containing protein [Chloroflexota bacterium]
MTCPICKGPIGTGGMKLRYEGRHYTFCSLRCKMTFQENPDRWLDAGGEVLAEPR